jgi:hypothetical protein
VAAVAQDAANVGQPVSRSGLTHPVPARADLALAEIQTSADKSKSRGARYPHCVQRLIDRETAQVAETPAVIHTEPNARGPLQENRRVGFTAGPDENLGTRRSSSHLNSYDHPPPPGISPRVASIGRSNGSEPTRMIRPPNRGGATIDVCRAAGADSSSDHRSHRPAAEQVPHKSSDPVSSRCTASKKGFRLLTIASGG